MTPYNPAPPSVSTSPTSVAAAESMRPCAAKIREVVRKRIAWSETSGATCDEVEMYTELSHQTASARIRELALSGHIIAATTPDGKPVRRLTRSGRKATVWVAANHTRRCQ